MIGNNFKNINRANYHRSPQIIEYKKYHDDLLMHIDQIVKKIPSIH
jgi:hypothetical protein